MSLVTSLGGVLSVTDNLTGSIALNRALNIAFTGTVFSYDQTLSVGTSPVSPVLPINPVQVVFLQNNSTTASVLITWTKNNGASVGVLTLDPGGFIFFSETSTSNGITALSLTASAASTPISVVLAG